MDYKKEKMMNGFLALRVMILVTGLILSSASLYVCGLSMRKAEVNLRDETEGRMFFEKFILCLVKNHEDIRSFDEIPPDISISAEGDLKSGSTFCLIVGGDEKECTELKEEDLY